ncbi:MAG: hypothetical protein V2I27_09405 [Erythrobacter sp.]|jgi:hypothetical protein|nr:hypothetical protein [Erythrobacter sp.]
MAGQRNGHRIEELAVMAGAALNAQPIAKAGEIGDLAKVFAAHARAMPCSAAVGNARREQSGNKAVGEGRKARFGSHKGSHEIAVLSCICCTFSAS